MNRMQAVTRLKLPINRLKATCYDSMRLGLTFLRCNLFQVHEEVVTDHLIISKDGVRVLDQRE